MRRVTFGRPRKAAALLVPAAVLITCLATATQVFGGGLDGILAPVLDVGASLADEAGHEAAEKINDALGLLHKALLSLGGENALEVSYVPEDPPDAVHMRHDPEADPKSRYAELKAKVTYALDWESKIPAATARQLADLSLPNQGALDGVPVRFHFPPNLLRYVELRQEDWDGLSPTWWKATGKDGVATVHLYPRREQPLGGIKKTIEGKVVAYARFQRGVGANAVSLGAQIGEELAGGGAKAEATVRIERHIPTRWKGSAKVYRTVNRSWGTTSRDPNKIDETRVTQVSGSQLWQATLKIDQLELDETGVGDATYTYDITGEGNSTRVQKHRKKNSSGAAVTYVDTLKTNARGRGGESGKVSLEIEVDPKEENPTYALLVKGSGIGSKAMNKYQGWGSNGSQVHTWTDEDGQHSVNTNSELAPAAGGMSALLFPGSVRPLVQWPAFDRDAQTYSNELTWEEDFPSKDGTQRYHVVTTVEWNLERIAPEGQ